MSTIPEVSSQREGSINLNNNKSQPPDLIVHSTTAGNWQEHSFDSSIVTEGHYDASFESECLPNEIAPVSTQQQSAVVSAVASTAAARSRPPPLAHSAKKSVFSGSSLPSVSETVQTTCSSTVSTCNTSKPSSLMLWKKVQHYVVVGGAFVSSAAANNSTNEQLQSNPQQDIRPTTTST